MTTTAETSGVPRARAGAGQRDDDEEEQEAGGERLVRVNAEAPEEADEERFADGEPVDGERNEHHEEQERPHHVIGPRREVDPYGLGAEPDREHAHRLHTEGECRNPEQQARVLAVGVKGCVDLAGEPLGAERSKQRPGQRQQRPHPAREEKEAGEDGPDDEDELDPDVGADVVMPDREQEADRGQHERGCAADRPLEED